MRLLSDASDYALRAVVWLAARPGQTRKLHEIAEATKATPGYLIRALQSLTRAGIVSAQRGSQGGFRLKRMPADLTVLEVINAIDPIERIRSCPLGLAEHCDRLCPMHQRIDDAMAAIEQSFAASTIEDLMSDPAATQRMCAGLTGTDSGGA